MVAIESNGDQNGFGYHMMAGIEFLYAFAFYSFFFHPLSFKKFFFGFQPHLLFCLPFSFIFALCFFLSFFVPTTQFSLFLHLALFFHSV